MFLGRGPLAYSRLLGELWAARKPFLVVEHDIEVTSEALTEALDCTCTWGVSPYRGPDQGLIDRALGFTRFRPAIMEASPDAMSRANAINDHGPGAPPGHWKLLDARLLSVLTGDGHRPHLHSEVPHHHRYDKGCACGRDHA